MPRDHGLAAEILLMVFENLVGDTETFIRVGLVCRSWRALSLPLLLRDSSHNNGRLHEHDELECFFRPFVMADYSDQFRPRNLVTRQRAFLRLMTHHPELARHVKAFTWTLVWMDFDDDSLTDIDLHTWVIFGRMQNVARLDLASLHYIGDQPYIRQAPARLFPAVTHLRLVGWMHRGLVRAIVTSIDATKLRSLKLDRLQDEGALPDGGPMQQDVAWEYASDHRGDPYSDQGIDDDLWARQERGHAAIFPGPMWFPLRLLRQYRLAAMAHLEIRLGSFDLRLDERNQITMFHETAQFIRSTKETLKTIYIGLGEGPTLHCEDEDLVGICGTSRVRIRGIYRPMCFDLTSAFLHRLLPVLTEERFPHLTQVDLEGFRIIRNGRTALTRHPNPDLTWQYIRSCPFVDERFTETPNVDYRAPFDGYDLPDPEPAKLEEWKDILERS